MRIFFPWTLIPRTISRVLKSVGLFKPWLWLLWYGGAPASWLLLHAISLWLYGVPLHTSFPNMALLVWVYLLIPPGFLAFMILNGLLFLFIPQKICTGDSEAVLTAGERELAAHEIVSVRLRESASGIGVLRIRYWFNDQEFAKYSMLVPRRLDRTRLAPVLERFRP